jgi:NAD(P)-dependent dehydrogenase (short-subunit alcohol dehydrogenase family)
MLPTGLKSLVIGAAGGIGGALLEQLQRHPGHGPAAGAQRQGEPAVDLTDELTLAALAAGLRACDAELRLAIVATGFLGSARFRPERGIRDLNLEHLQHAFAINAFGPALLMKHLFPLLPRSGRVVFACLSARVGSIGDNRLGGWYSYRASKAALNQLVRTASIELRRYNPDSICVALHPGTVATRLSAEFTKTGLKGASPSDSAVHLLNVIDSLTSDDTGAFFDYARKAVPW